MGWRGGGTPEEREGSPKEWGWTAICRERDALPTAVGLQDMIEDLSFSLLSPISVSSSSAKQGRGGKKIHRLISSTAFIFTVHSWDFRGVEWQTKVQALQ